MHSALTQMSSTLDTPKYIEHYQFTSWPDQLLPENSSPVLTLHKKALANASWEGPILVHCRYTTAIAATHRIRTVLPM